MPQTKFMLDESDIPTHWYNVIADMPNPPSPPLGPDGKPISPQALGAIFPEAIIMQEGAPPVRTSPTPPCRRPGTTSRPASSVSPPKPARGSGVRHWRWPDRCL